METPEEQDRRREHNSGPTCEWLQELGYNPGLVRDNNGDNTITVEDGFLVLEVFNTSVEGNKPLRWDEDQMCRVPDTRVVRVPVEPERLAQYERRIRRS